MTRFFVAIVTVALGAGLALAGCKKEEKDYTCDEMVDVMYDEGCELWCNNDGSSVYLDQCAWYDDNDPGNFEESFAREICDEMQDRAEDEDCESEFQALINCAAEEVDDECSEDCEDANDEFNDCMNW